MSTTRARRILGITGVLSTLLAGAPLVSGALAATTPPPAVQSVSPAAGSYTKPNGQAPSVSAAFDRNIDPTRSKITVFYAGNPIPGSSSVDTRPAPIGHPDTVTWTPAANWNLAARTYTARAHGVDATNSALATDYEWSFTIDGTAPSAPLVNKPPVITASNVSNFPITGTAEAGATVNVAASDGSALNNAAGSAKADSNGNFSVPVDMSSLNNGSISITVTVMDAAGNVSPATIVTTTKDATPPPAPTITTPAAVTEKNAAWYPLSGMEGTPFNPPSDFKVIQVVVTDSNGAKASATTNKINNPNNWNVHVALTNLADGTLTIAATAYDTTGNGATTTTTVTKTTTGFAKIGENPLESSTDFPPDTISETFSHPLQQQDVKDNLGNVTMHGSSITLSLDGVYLSCSPGFSADGRTIYCTPPGPLTPGKTYVVNVDAWDQTTPTQQHATSSSDPSTQYSFTVGVSGITAKFDTTKVDGSNNTAVPVSGTGLPGGQVALTFSSSAGGTAVAVTDQNAPVVDDTGNWSGTYDLSRLGDGSLTVAAREVDPSGNAKTASATVTKDARPSAPQNVVAGAGDGTAWVTWTAPASDGNSPVTGYRVTASDGTSQVVTGTLATFSGLANGTAYTFSVVALTKASPAGGPAATSNSVTPRYVASLTVNVSPSRITYGQLATIYGTLTRVSTGVPIANRTITIYGRQDNNSLVRIGSTVTDSAGQWGLRNHAGRNLKVFAVFNGDAADQPRQSGSVRLLVSPKVSVSSKTNGSTSSAGTALVITGSVAPNFQGKYIQLWSYNGSKHSTTQQVRLDKHSQYRFTVNPGRGTWKLRVVIVNPPLNTTGASGYLTVKRT